MNDVARERMRKRFKDARYQQDKRGSCLICKEYFYTCPHSFADIYALAEIMKQDETRKKYRL